MSASWSTKCAEAADQHRQLLRKLLLLFCPSNDLVTMTDNSGRRLTAALTFILLAGAAGVVANRSVVSVAAPPRAAAPSAAQATGVTAGWSHYSIGSRMMAVMKAAEAEPHGDIGEPAVAQAPSTR